MKRKAVFLDRDGVINVDYGYVHEIDDFAFIDGIFDLVSLANRLGFIVLVVTNQAGIARGLYTEADFLKLTTWMLQQFKSKNAKIDRVYHSPFHPIDGIGFYKKDEQTRKPNPGMIIRGIDEFKLDPSKSILIGDSISDIKAGVSAGLSHNVLLREDESCEDKELDSVKISLDFNQRIHKIRSLSEARCLIKRISALGRSP